MIEDEIYNSLKWENIDGLKLSSFLKGYTIVEAEPIDYPLTDGILLLLKGREGEYIALEIGAEEGQRKAPPLYIRYAPLPPPGV